MKMQLSTAKVLQADLDEKIAAASADDGEIELSPVARALINDAIARDSLDQAIDEAE